MRLCEVEGCDGRHKARGLCEHHYRRALYVTRNRPRRSAPLASTRGLPKMRSGG